MTNLCAETLPLGSAPVRCLGRYPGHLQGVCANAHNALFWSFTTVLVKTDSVGSVSVQKSVPAHHGAPCYALGRLYVPVNLTAFNNAEQHADSWIYVYDPATLTLLYRHRTPEVIFGAGAIAFYDGQFVVAGGLPEGYPQNHLYLYDEQLYFVREVLLEGGYTRKGIQTIVFGDGHWWFGCYAAPEQTEVLSRTDLHFSDVRRYSFDCSLGILKTSRGYLVARDNTSSSFSDGFTGKLVPATTDTQRGLVLR